MSTFLLISRPHPHYSGYRIALPPRVHTLLPDARPFFAFCSGTTSSPMIGFSFLFISLLPSQKTQRDSGNSRSPGLVQLRLSEACKPESALLQIQKHYLAGKFGDSETYFVSPLEICMASLVLIPVYSKQHWVWRLFPSIAT